MAYAFSMKLIVTGGGGFVGKALARKLRAQGHEVVAVARGAYPELENAGITLARIDLGVESPELAAVFSGAAAVFHTAAKVDMWGVFQDFYQTNVLGTRHVIAACLKAGVGKLIFTSSPSVIADGTNLAGVDESYPYPQRYTAYYPQTKAMAEKEVLSANRENELHTIALRPHLIFGPGDRNFIPTIIKRAHEGRLVQVGPGDNLTDLCFIDDCVQAHLLALEALDKNPICRGRAYFITQGEPVNLWQFINQILKLHGLPPIKKKVPKQIAMLLAAAFELWSRLSPRHPEPLFTRFLVSQMTVDHYFNISRARQDLSYRPSRSIKEAILESFGNRKLKTY